VFDIFSLKKEGSQWEQQIRRVVSRDAGFFLELSSAALATAGIVGDANVARAGSGPANTEDAAKADPAPITGKIALEEHFLLPETGAPDPSLGFAVFTPELLRQLKDMGSGRIAEMDRGGRGTRYPFQPWAWDPDQSERHGGYRCGAAIERPSG
jgi:hypothetical protein